MGVFVLLLVSLGTFASAEISSKMGINYGQLGSNLPSPRRSVELLKSMKAGRVKLYNADPEILGLLAGTDIQVTIMVPNQQISNISSSQALAHQWVRRNVLPFYRQTRIRFLLVGNEVLSAPDRRTWHDLVPAMRRVKAALKAYNIGNVKVSTPVAMDALQATFPPSAARFRHDISDLVVRPLLRFLSQTNSYFFLDAYPYFSWAANPARISLDYALFRSNRTYTDPGSGLSYANLLDQMLDSVLAAMSGLGYPNIRLALSETGWPNAGDVGEPGANLGNAAAYNRNLIKKMTAKPPLGTPARPGVVLPTFLFSLYNEDMKDGPGTERHWGLLDGRGDPLYRVDLTGKMD